ncbi:hypothetical protein BH09CHL1_BH09CHL1_24740 [soil metagenome]
MPSFSFHRTNQNVYHNSVGAVPGVGPFSAYPNSVEKGAHKGLPYGWLFIAERFCSEREGGHKTLPYDDVSAALVRL